VQEALITQRALQAEYAVEPDEQLMVTFEETAETAFSSIDEIVAAYPDTATVLDAATRVITIAALLLIAGDRDRLPTITDLTPTVPPRNLRWLRR
jgi:hypothetical protein